MEKNFFKKKNTKCFLKLKLRKLLDICSFGTFSVSAEKLSALPMNAALFSTKQGL